MPDFKSTSVRRANNGTGNGTAGKINSSLKVKKKGTGNETGLTGYSADSSHSSSEIHQTNGKSLFCMTQRDFVRKFQVFPHIFHLASRTCFSTGLQQLQQRCSQQTMLSIVYFFILLYFENCEMQWGRIEYIQEGGGHLGLFKSEDLGQQF